MNDHEHVEATEYFDTLRKILTEDLGGSGSALRAFIRDNRQEHDRFRSILLQERQEVKTAQQEASISTTEIDSLKEAIASEMQLTSQPEVVIWANQQLDYFTNASSAIDPREKRKRIDRIASLSAEHLFQNMSEIDTAVSTWRSQNRSEISSETPFHDHVAAKLVELIEKRWEREQGKPSPEPISEKDLTTLISIYTHSPLASEAAEQLLRQYFIGAKKSVEKPRSNSGRQGRNQQQEEYQLRVRGNRVHALYNFALAAFNLIDDPSAFKKAQEILIFGNDKVLPLTVDYVADFFIALFNAIDHRQIPIMRKALLLYMVVPKSSRLIGLEDANDRFHQFAQRNPQVIEHLRVNTRHLVAKYTNLNVEEHLLSAQDAISRYAQGTVRTEQTSVPWPYNVSEDTTDKLNRKYMDYLAPEVESYRLAQDIMEMVRVDSGEKEFVTVSLKVPGDSKFILTTVVPRSLISNISTILQRCLEDYSHRADERADLLDTPFSHAGMAMRLMTGNIEVDKTKLYFWVRPAGEREDSQHELLALQSIGFPKPYIEKGQNLTDVNTRLAREIFMTQLRFPNKRGYRVPLDKTQLGQFGFTSVDFMKDTQHKDKIVVRFNMGKVSLSIKLDRYFMFDFEGKTFPNISLHEALHNTVLCLLKPILCEPSAEIEDQPELEETRTIVSRVGHLMLLPKGRYYSATAVKNCWLEEGRDLQMIDKERQMDALKKAEKAMDEGDLVKAQELLDKSDRITTYVRPVRTEAEQYALPVTVFVDPNILVFGSN